jgi:tetratricopeptide (TPR) repeat protein
LEIAPDYTLPYYHLAVVSYYNKKYRKALRLFKKSQTSANPFVDKAYGFAALCHMRLKEFSAAKKEMIEALSINPSQILYHRLFRMLDSQKIHQEKKFSFSQAFKLLSHRDQKMRSEATVYFLSLPPKALSPLLKLYKLAHYKPDDKKEFHFRLFYILSEKLPHLMVGRALAILNNKEEAEYLKILSLMLVSKTSPQHLNSYYRIFSTDKNFMKKSQAEFDILQKFYAKK